VFGYAIVSKTRDTFDGEFEDYYDLNVDTDGVHKGQRVPENITEDAMFKARSTRPRPACSWRATSSTPAPTSGPTISCSRSPRRSPRRSTGRSKRPGWSWATTRATTRSWPSSRTARTPASRSRALASNMRKGGRVTKRRLTSIRLDKIAAVDLPCQEHATVAIVKRAPQDPRWPRQASFDEALRAQLVSERISDVFWRAFDNQYAVREAFRESLADELAEGGDGTQQPRASPQRCGPSPKRPRRWPGKPGRTRRTRIWNRPSSRRSKSGSSSRRRQK
jgi:hypothetical protein